MAVRAGQLRHRVTLQEETEAQDSYGEPVGTWGNLSTNPAIWARKEDLSGAELAQAQQLNAVVTTRFTVRYRADITASMRVVHGSDSYGIESVQDPDGRQERLYLLCSRSVN